MTIQTFPAGILLPNDKYPGVFVFGANEHGVHGAGAARVAHDQLDYPTGAHDILAGKNKAHQHGAGLAYGISTKHDWRDPGSLRVIATHIIALEQCIADNPELTFNITAIGTGYAGLIFAEVSHYLLYMAGYPNVRFDERWLPYLSNQE